MTIDETIEELQTSIKLAKMCTQNLERKREIQGYEMAIKALKEVQQYRKHGVTVESALDNMCDLAAAEDLIEEYRAIGTPEECRVAVEKQKPFKPETVGLTIGIGRCKCGAEFLDSKTNYCGNCGQKLNWNRRANDGKTD